MIIEERQQGSAKELQISEHYISQWLESYWTGFWEKDFYAFGERRTSSHHRFVCGKSCLTNVAECFEEVNKIDKGWTEDFVYMDFNKALDEVPDGRLV